MTWNWQKSDWPYFTSNRTRLERAEQQFLLGGGVLVGTVKHLSEEDRQQLTVDAMSTEALTTSEIEGEILDRAGVPSSIRKQLGLTVDERRVRPAEQGIAARTRLPRLHCIHATWSELLESGARSA
jgi:Fic family protein